MASREHGVANRPDTLINLGSINTLFTRVAVAQLAAAGTLSLDDRLGKWLPDDSNAAARHISGIAWSGASTTGEASRRTRSTKNGVSPKHEVGMPGCSV